MDPSKNPSESTSSTSQESEKPPEDISKFHLRLYIWNTIFFLSSFVWFNIISSNLFISGAIIEEDVKKQNKEEIEKREKEKTDEKTQKGSETQRKEEIKDPVTQESVEPSNDDQRRRAASDAKRKSIVATLCT